MSAPFPLFPYAGPDLPGAVEVIGPYSVWPRRQKPRLRTAVYSFAGVALAVAMHCGPALVA